MNEKNIRKLLKMYGATQQEIDNFMEDLKKMPEIDEPSDTFDEDYEDDITD